MTTDDRKPNRRRRTIIVILTVLLCALGITFNLSSDFKYKKTLKFRGHEIEYDQYFKGKKKVYEGHYVQNQDLEDQAYMILANRLLDDYLKNPDAGLRDDILKIRNEHSFIRGLEITSIDSLVADRKILMAPR